jgi:hypothetical protein
VLTACGARKQFGFGSQQVDSRVTALCLIDGAHDPPIEGGMDLDGRIM